MDAVLPVVVRAADRFVTRTPGIESRHCFSFGAHYAAGNLRFGAVLACNEETVAPGAGFDTHQHTGVDVVTWVVEGVLEHADSTGGRSLARPGVVHVLRAGSGVEHSERNPGPGRLRFVQTWLAAADPAGAPAFERRDLGAELGTGSLLPIAAGEHDVLVYAGRLRPGESHELPAGRCVHIYLVRGSASLPAAGTLREGDSARFASQGAVIAAENDGAELIICEMSPPL